MKNNKGISLVELIIVIAIIVILVVVMVIQLISYIEKTKVSADNPKEDSVYTAVPIAMMDPEILNVSSYNSEFVNFQSGQRVTALSTEKGIIGSAVLEILGTTAGSELTGSLKSTGASDTQFRLESGYNPVWVSESDYRGSKTGSPFIVVE